MQQPQPQLKTWRVAHHNGVEFEKFANLNGFVLPSFFLEHYDITVTNGAGKVTQPGRTVKVERPNTVLMQNVGETVRVEVNPGQQASAWTLRIYPEAALRLMQNWTESHHLPAFCPVATDLNVNTMLASCIRGAIDCFEQPRALLERDTKLKSVMYLLIKHCSDKQLACKKPGKEHNSIKLIKDKLNAEPAHEHTLKDLAEICHLNEKYLLDVFKQAVGVTPHVYQTRLRINRAKELLTKQLSIAQVAADTGFVDQSHLHRTFKRLVGVTPGQFQRDSY